MHDARQNRDPPHRERGEDVADERLAAACAAGDREAFNRLHARLGNGVRAFLGKRLPGRDELIEELSQRAWVGVWGAFEAGRYDPSRSAVSTFVYAVANKVWLQYLREARRGSDNSAHRDPEAWAASIEAVVTDADDPSGLMTDAEVLECVRTAIRDEETPEALTGDERAVIMAAAAGGSDRVLAARFGFSPSTINAKKRSGWDKVRRALARRGYGDVAGDGKAKANGLRGERGGGASE